MKTARNFMIILLLVGVVVALALALVGALAENQELVKDVVVDLVVSNVDGHPDIDAIVEKVPADCQKCHEQRANLDAYDEIAH